jgi:hypothetical protein
MTVTNAANVASSDAKSRCRHCGELVYQSGVSGSWLHWATVQRHCERPTVAEPEGHE